MRPTSSSFRRCPAVVAESETRQRPTRPSVTGEPSASRKASSDPISGVDVGRREVLRWLAAAPVAAGTAGAWRTGSTASAVEPFARSGPPRFRLGVAAYSLRQEFGYQKGRRKEPVGRDQPLDMIGFLDDCVRWGVEAAELTSYFFQPGPDGFPTDDRLRTVRREAFLRGVAIVGTAIGNNFTVGPGPRLQQEIADAKRWIRKASVLGAPHIRFFAGTADELAESPTRLDEAVQAIRECATVASEHGIFLGVENHGRLSADQVLAIMERIDSPWVGVNLDTGNFVSETPYDDLKRCAPYAVNVQVKANMKSPSGERYPADFDRIADILRDANYQGFVVLEFEEEDSREQIPRFLDQLRQAFGVS